MSIELPPLKLPPLPSLPSRSFADHERYIIQLRDAMKARERILVAEIDRLRAECEAMRMVPSELPPIPDNWHMPITDQERANEEAFRRGWNACCKAVAARSAP